MKLLIVIAVCAFVAVQLSTAGPVPEEDKKEVLAEVAVPAVASPPAADAPVHVAEDRKEAAPVVSAAPAEAPAVPAAPASPAGENKS